MYIRPQRDQAQGAMITARCSIRTLWFGLLLLVACVVPAAAQSPMGDQLELFRNLSPEQQQALLQQLGGQNGTGRQDRGSLEQGDSDRQASDSADAERRRRSRREEQEPLIPVLK